MESTRRQSRLGSMATNVRERSLAIERTVCRLSGVPTVRSSSLGSTNATSLTRAFPWPTRFGADADALCAERQLIVDAVRRTYLVRQIADAVRFAGCKLTREMEGDFSSDPIRPSIQISWSRLQPQAPRSRFISCSNGGAPTTRTRRRRARRGATFPRSRASSPSWRVGAYAWSSRETSGLGRTPSRC